MDTAVPPQGGSADALSGRLLDGRYRLERVLARGGMATVYTGTDTRLDRPVAVKVLRAGLAEDPEFVERFTREARAAARLESPDAVAVFDHGRDAATGAAYLVMELVRGGTLRDVLREHGHLPPAQALALLEPVLRALAAAHAAGLVHRDVKPENVLVADDGRVKVADFGLARAFETSSGTATRNWLMGTVAYLSPEQVQHGNADPRSDVYSAGVMLWELLTGTPPFTADAPMSVAFQHVHEDVPPPSTVVPEVPPAVDELVLRATRRDPSARPVDAGALLAEVRAVLSDLPDDAPTVVVRRPSTGSSTLVVPRTPSRPQRPEPDRRRRRTVLLSLLVLLLGALALGGGWYLGTGRYADVPDVVGSDEPAARATLASAGFEVEVDPEGRHDEQIPPGRVAEQSPDAGSRLQRGRTVTLALSLGPDRRAVPALAGQDVEAATAALEEAGLRAGPVVEEFSDVPVGAVVRTEPAEGERLRPDTPVSLVVSKGLELLPVPDVVGSPSADAARALQAAGLGSTVREVFSDTVPPGVVVAQDPREGTAPRGSAVVLEVSKGPDLVPVPATADRPGAEAVAAVEAAGLRARVVDVPGGTDRVLRTDPEAGVQVRRGSTVTLYTF